jgi:hypothetical protein
MIKTVPIMKKSQRKLLMNSPPCDTAGAAAGIFRVSRKCSELKILDAAQGTAAGGKEVGARFDPNFYANKSWGVWRDATRRLNLAAPEPGKDQTTDPASRLPHD